MSIEFLFPAETYEATRVAQASSDNHWKRS